MKELKTNFSELIKYISPDITKTAFRENIEVNQLAYIRLILDVKSESNP